MRLLKTLAVVSSTAIIAVTAFTSSPAQAAQTCHAASGHLYCGNVYNASIKQIPAYDQNGVPVKTVDNLHSTFSYFECYTTGQQHSGGNNIWYHTYGDVTHKWGYVAAAAVYTPTDPFPGVKHC